MTTLRPERPADGPMSYEDTGQFEAVVGRLADPLNDPLPTRPPAVPDTPGPAPAAGPEQAPRRARHGAPTPAPAPAPAPPPAATPAPAPVRPATSPWFAAPGMSRGAAAPASEAAAAPAPAPEAPGPAPAPPPAYAAGAPGPGAPVPDAVDETARLPVVEEPPAAAVPVPAPGPAPESAPRLAPPADGGRAARRKAARQSGGGHRARSRTAAAPAPEPPGDAGAPAAPLSRVEARRAARAAKDSPAVVASRIVGELFITLGVLMLLFVTYQLWWTNVRAHAEANRASNHLEQQWATTSQDPARNPGLFSPGQGFAIMYIPKLDVKAPIAQGVDKHKVLDKGMIGHYDGALNTAMPWDRTGNFAVAAHRNTHGEPFRYINRLTPGDKVVVETATTYYTYQVTSSLPSTPPSNTDVLRPVPPGSGFTKPGRYITLTTCTPEFTSTNRLVVWGRLIEERPRSKGKPDALLKG